MSDSTEIPSFGLGRRIESTPVTIGLLIAIVLLGGYVIAQSIKGYAWISDISGHVDQVESDFKASKAERDLRVQLRDAQIDTLRQDVKGIKEHQATTDAAVVDMKTTLARIDTNVTTLKEQLAAKH